MIKKFSAYIEQLCRRHKKLRHTDEDRHFVNLNEDSKDTSLVDELRYPAVFFETTGYKISGSSIDEMKKTYTCHIEAFTHVSDTGDYGEVESALSETEQILYGWMAEVMLQVPFCITDNKAFLKIE